jgi:hypothetical protein
MSHEYNPKVKMFYGTVGDSDSRITPAPVFSLSTELEYSNDAIIGYKYVITLNGQITAVNLADGSSSGEFGIGSIIDHAYNIRKLLSQNGNILTITDDYDTERPILKAKGGILRSFDISDSPNNWTHYVNYSATIEFQAIDFIGASWQDYTLEDCSTIFLSDDTHTKGIPGILDVSKYKIKSFEDSWSFNFNENDTYEKSMIGSYDIDNRGFSIEYSINATGKNAYVYTDESTSEVKIVPGWEQAKNFVQYRLYHQVTGLINGVLNNSKGEPCSPTGSLSNLTEPSPPGILNNFDSLYSVFNETVNCDISEADGTYSVSYSAIVKRNSTGPFTSTNAKHRISKSIKTDNNNGSKITNITVDGSIEGLIPGGLIRGSQPVITLPEKGSFFISNGAISGKNLTNTKYSNAKSLADTVISSGAISLDLNSLFKNALGISYANPISINLTHDHINGTINYNVEYSSNRECGQEQTTTTVQTDASVPVFARFDIPNSGSGPVYQSLGTRTAQKVTVTVQGSSNKECNNILNNIFSESVRPNIPITINGTLIDSKYTRNLKDGSYTLVKTFIDSQGCSAF